MPGSNDDDLVVQVYEVLDHDMHDMSCCSKQFGSICLCSGGRAEGWPSENKLMRVKPSFFSYAAIGDVVVAVCRPHYCCYSRSPSTIV